MTHWQGPGGAAYAKRFDDLAAGGADVHGEAALVERLCRKGSRVLDAGCGTGRVAIRLAERGYDVVGMDVDPDMLSVARERAPDLTWIAHDLAEPIDGTYDVVVAAGNVIPLATRPDAVSRNLARSLAPQGILVVGFGLDARHLPAGTTPVTLADYDAWTGLPVRDRYATWAGEPYAGGGYAVTVTVRA